MFQKILVVVDALREVHPELGRAIQLAKATSGHLHIVDSVKDLNWLSRLFQQQYAQVYEETIAQRQSKLEGLVHDCQTQGVPATCQTLIGNSSEQIIAEAERTSADLIVRYAKGQHSLSKEKLGTTSQRLIRRLPCAIYLHRQQHEPIKIVVAAVDATPEDQDHAALNCQIVQVAQSLASQNAARLRIIYAWTLYGEQLLRDHLPVSQYKQLVEHSRREHTEGLEQLLAKQQLPPDVGCMLEGDPSLAVPQFCAENQADLLVCGTIARTGIPGLLLGNTIERIMQQVDCSILALPKH